MASWLNCTQQHNNIKNKFVFLHLQSNCDYVILNHEKYSLWASSSLSYSQFLPPLSWLFHLPSLSFTCISSYLTQAFDSLWIHVIHAESWLMEIYIIYDTRVLKERGETVFIFSTLTFSLQKLILALQTDQHIALKSISMRHSKMYCVDINVTELSVIIINTASLLTKFWSKVELMPLVHSCVWSPPIAYAHFLKICIQMYASYLYMLYRREAYSRYLQW